MNKKNIIFIAGTVAILGLIASVVFGLMDIVTFGTTVVAVTGALYGWLKQVENTKLKLAMNDEVEKAEQLRLKYTKLETEHNGLTHVIKTVLEEKAKEDLEASQVKEQNNISEIQDPLPLAEVNPNFKYNKPKRKPKAKE